jgi:hypothetical protein
VAEPAANAIGAELALRMLRLVTVEDGAYLRLTGYLHHV